jgi:hypothetical protein
VFDYSAGEKFKLTLIMVGFAGLMAGMFFTLLLMPTSEAPQAHRRQMPKWASDPDVTGGRGGPRMPGPAASAQAAAQADQPSSVDQSAAMALIGQWLDLAWDMSAGTAASSQQKAIAYMTPDCAAAYQSNVWTPEVAKQVEESGLKSTFTKTSVTSGGIQQDGTLLVNVEGQQVLSVPGKGEQVRQVKLQYLLTQTPDGIRIAGISETPNG